MDSDSKSQIKIYGNDALSSRVASFQKKAESHELEQKSNPFSHTGAVSGMPTPKWDKNDPHYGRPAEGSKTEQRGIAAGNHIGNEVLFLCEMIHEYGVPGSDKTVSITFGELFQIYTTISNKVVGILLRARKHGFVQFEGEILFQRKDDNVIITLLKPISELFPNRIPLKRKQIDREPVTSLAPEDY